MQTGGGVRVPTTRRGKSRGEKEEEEEEEEETGTSPKRRQYNLNLHDASWNRIHMITGRLCNLKFSTMDDVIGKPS